MYSVNDVEEYLTQFPEGLPSAALAARFGGTKSEVNSLLYSNKSIFIKITETQPPLWKTKKSSAKKPTLPDRLALNPQISKSLETRIFGELTTFKIIFDETSRNDEPVAVEVVSPNNFIVLISRTYEDSSSLNIDNQTRLNSFHAALASTALLFEIAKIGNKNISTWSLEYAKLLKFFAVEVAKNSLFLA